MYIIICPFQFKVLHYIELDEFGFSFVNDTDEHSKSFCIQFISIQTGYSEKLLKEFRSIIVKPWKISKKYLVFKVCPEVLKCTFITLYKKANTQLITKCFFSNLKQHPNKNLSKLFDHNKINHYLLFQDQKRKLFKIKKEKVLF